MSMNDMVQVNRVYLIILFFNRPQFLVDSNEKTQTFHPFLTTQKKKTLNVTGFPLAFSVL